MKLCQISKDPTWQQTSMANLYQFLYRAFGNLVAAFRWIVQNSACDYYLSVRSMGRNAG